MPKEIHIPFTALRRAGADTIDNVRRHKEWVVITNYNKPVAAIVSIEDFEMIKEANKKNDRTDSVLKHALKPVP